MVEIDINFVKDLLANGEGQMMDKKKSGILSNNTKVAELLTSFANTQGGCMLIGVSDDGKPEGLAHKKGYIGQIVNITRDKCDPPLAPEIVPVYDGSSCIYVVNVKRFNTVPHATRTEKGNVYFIRVGDSTRKATPLELKTLFEQGIPSKEPSLVLSLLDALGNINEFTVEPTFHVEAEPKVVNGTALPEISKQLVDVTNSLSNLGFLTGTGKNPTENLVPITISLKNNGTSVAEGIRITLEFPKECKLHEANEFYNVLIPVNMGRRNVSGLYIDDYEINKNCYARVDKLGNDLQIDDFDYIYVEFPNKTETYRIKANITQHNFPPKDFEFIIHVKPKVKS